ncbi:MAG: hypothetical protein RBU21_24490 [FCB group bacterium]|jgi:phage shock protein B|nr:hypothetical protein [FCB group bacterium]
MDEYTFVLSLITVCLVYRLIVALVLKRRSGGESPAQPESPATEMELLRELHHGMIRMEKRVEALETLLAERDEIERATANEKPR